MHARTEAMRMGGAGGVRKVDDPVAEPWTARGRVPPGREKERPSRTGAVRLVCVMALPLLVFFVLGRESAAMVWESAGAKLTAMNSGFIDASHASTTGARTKPDELLGGLLAPGSDRRSCLSRYQSPQYYKHFPYPPSSHLQQKLRAYEARHMKCAPGTPLYAKSVEHLRSSNRSTQPTECSYLVWHPYNGLGNRMLSMVSGFLYALLTDRVFLVDMPQDSTDLFCEPFPDSTWVLPVADRFGRLGHSYRNLLDEGRMVNDPANTTAPPVPPSVYLYLGHGHGFMDSMFYCSDDQRVLAKVKWLLFRTDLYLVPSLHSIPVFQDELRRLFPAKESVAHLLARYLFHPSNSVWGLVMRYYHSYLAHAKQRIGVQIRMLPFATIPVDDMYNQILACSRQEHVLPEIDGGEAAAAATGGNLSETTSGGGNGTTAILVASMFADYYERMRSAYYEHAAKGGVWVGVFQPTHEERQASGELGHNQKALAEIYLLAFSEALLTSGKSTFGYVSSSLAGVRPTILLCAFGRRVPKTPCVRAASMEPCNHEPPRVRCQGKAVDEGGLARHVRGCEDESRGVKLFD
ncbi:hypothetical protein ACP70R_036556 [Stipagrostis hirtigluma subsp. patula]